MVSSLSLLLFVYPSRPFRYTLLICLLFSSHTKALGYLSKHSQRAAEMQSVFGNMQLAIIDEYINMYMYSIMNRRMMKNLTALLVRWKLLRPWALSILLMTILLSFYALFRTTTPFYSFVFFYFMGGRKWETFNNPRLYLLPPRRE